MSNVSTKFHHIARIFLGLAFFVFGLNGFLHFLPQPPLPLAAQGFLGGLASSGYFFPLLKGTEVLAGIFLLSNRFVPLAVTVLAPITLNILAFHVFLAPAPALPILLIAAQLYVAYGYREVFSRILNATSKPEFGNSTTSVQVPKLA